MNVQTEKTKIGVNGHSNGNGQVQDPSTLRFNDIVAELENLPSVTPESLAQKPAWLRNPVTKARGLFLMVIKKANESAGIVVTPAMLLVIILAFVGSLGTTIKILGDKIDANREATIAKAAEDKVNFEWMRSELRRVDNQNKINYELYRQQGENYKQILGYVQGRSGVRLVLPEVSAPQPPPQ